MHVVATTRRDLDAAVAGGAFRADLLHRLRTLSFEVPPLRERGDEILCIARRLCEELAPRYRRNGVEVAGEAEAVLRRHPWPGNVRELRNALEHALLIETGSVLDAKVLEQVLARPRAGPGGAPLCELPEQGIDLGRMERDLIERALHQCGGNRTQAARFLGLSRYKLRYRMKKWGLD